MNIHHFYVALGAALLFSGCGGSGGGSSNNDSISQTALGEQLFFDTSLSLNRTMSCATCHNPDHGFMDARFHNVGDVNPVNGALSVGDDGLTLGGRNTPTAAYAQLAPSFSQDSEGVYTGGQFHDGRAMSLKAQAKGPFLDPAEMMMPSQEAVIDRVKENPDYIEAFEALFGATIFDDTATAYDKLAESIAKFERTELFAPFDSKYDRFRQCRDEGRSTNTCLSEGNWTLQEQAGMDLFFSNQNTNCAKCHTKNSESESAQESFTNFAYENIGTPKNLANLEAKGLDANTTDLGLGGRSDIADAEHYGKIKVPTLRNVAVTGPYMSNGVFNELRTVIAFYDHMAGKGDHPTNPETLEAWAEPEVNATVNRELLQDTNALSDDKVDALVAFLKTLTDQRYEYLLDDE